LATRRHKQSCEEGANMWLKEPRATVSEGVITSTLENQLSNSATQASRTVVQSSCCEKAESHSMKTIRKPTVLVNFG
jgi:hypothetical protein